MDLKVYPDLKYLSSVKGYGPLAGELEENHHDDDDEKGVEHLDDNDDNDDDGDDREDCDEGEGEEFMMMTRKRLPSELPALEMPFGGQF